MNNLVFLNDSIINKEIAFVLGIKFKSVSKSKINKKELYYASNTKEKMYLKSKGLKYKKNYIDFNYILNFLDKYNRKNEVFGRIDRLRKTLFLRRKRFLRSLEKINKIPNRKLALSEMLIKVLYSKPKDIDCEEIDIRVQIDEDGNVWGCCPKWVAKPFGNILTDRNPYDNYYARMIKLSSINKTFCFCNLDRCKYYNSKEIPNEDVNIDLNVNDKPEYVVIMTDKTCNLRCESCRKKAYIASKEQKEKVRLINQKILDTKWLESATLFMAGEGEIFFSKSYLELLDTIKHGKKLDVLSNGTLFNEAKWDLIKNKFDEVTVSISIDAATKETYTKLRHGNYDMLVKNINMLSKHRKAEDFYYFKMNFVIQKRNMNEILDFIKFAKKNNVDVIYFMKLSNWGTMTDKEYKEASLIIDDNYLDYDLYKIFQDPVFDDKSIDISAFKPYIEESKKIYKD